MSFLTLLPLLGTGHLQQADTMPIAELRVPDFCFQSAARHYCDIRGNEVGPAFSLYDAVEDVSRRVDGRGDPFKWLSAGVLAMIKVIATENFTRGAVGYLAAITPDTPVILDWNH